jgi:hypothetical protein
MNARLMALVLWINANPQNVRLLSLIAILAFAIGGQSLGGGGVVINGPIGGGSDIGPA